MKSKVNVKVQLAAILVYNLKYRFRFSIIVCCEPRHPIRGKVKGLASLYYHLYRYPLGHKGTDNVMYSEVNTMLEQTNKYWY